jgi:uncharacterized repeat protein (TIGR03803 family)
MRIPQGAAKLGRRISLLLAIGSLTGPVAIAQNAYTVVHAFDRGIDGRQPATSLILARDGNLYGTTEFGGVYGGGTIFRLKPDGTDERVLHSFNPPVDGRFPSALIQGTDGDFYGTAENPFGRAPFGIVFRMAPDGTFTILHGFTCGADGASPVASLIQADDGNFYGVTTGHASDECEARSTVFRMTPDGTLTTIHALVARTDGTSPSAPLIQARDGHLYGTTQFGGPSLGGTVFRITTDGTLTVLHAFHYPDDTEGERPRTALVEDDDGTLYGTTPWGGRCFDCGTVFRLSADGTFQVVYAFERGAETGMFPYAPLTRGRDGTFYGTTCSSRGGVFRVTPDGDLTVVHAFVASSDGVCPEGSLLEADDGALYGLASGGGPSSNGTIFRVTADGTFSVIYAFPGSTEGASPTTLLQAADGAIYGVAAEGGAFNRGTVFRLMDDGTATSVHTFTGGVDGAGPSALIQATDGNFYGLTTSGGDAGGGTFFQVAADGSFSPLYSFSGEASSTDHGSSGLLQATDGNIYFATSPDGDYGRGAVFRWTMDGTLTILHSFSGGPEGSQPIALLQATDGNLYGATSSGGALNHGTVFRLTADGTLTTLHDLAVGTSSHGLIQATDGNFYVTSGPNVLRITPDGDTAIVHTFGLFERGYPQGLMGSIDGNIYGAAFLGSVTGSIFRMTLDGSVAVLHAFSDSGDSDGANPRAAPIQANDGSLFGTTSIGGGPGKQGVVYRLILDDLQRPRVKANPGRAHRRGHTGRPRVRGGGPNEALSSGGERKQWKSLSSACRGPSKRE